MSWLPVTLLESLEDSVMKDDSQVNQEALHS